jgi:hypothetical protein
MVRSESSWQERIFQLLFHKRVKKKISSDEKMPNSDLASYFWTGRVALETIKASQDLWKLPDFCNILDMASGHGRVLRWFKYYYPRAKLTVCEVQKSGRDFCAREFGSETIASHVNLRQESYSRKFDLIWVGSLLTHLDIDSWTEIIDSLHSSLDSGGVLAFTTHGNLVAKRLQNRDSYGLSEEDRLGILEDYIHAGFAFRRYSEEIVTNVDDSEYGVSISAPSFVLNLMTRYSDMRIIFVGESNWANHQDVYLFVKKEIDEASPELMSNLY